MSILYSDTSMYHKTCLMSIIYSDTSMYNKTCIMSILYSDTSRGVGAILNKNTNICMALIIHGEIRYTFGVITYNFYLFTILPTKNSSNIIHLNTNGVFRLCSK